MNVDVVVDVPSVTVDRGAMPSVIVRWIVTPIPARPIRAVTRYPEIVIDDRSCNINRLVDIVVAIHVNVADNLYLDDIIGAAFDLDGSHVLEDILFQNRLYDNNVGFSFD